jgi:hypothetical protein
MEKTESTDKTEEKQVIEIEIIFRFLFTFISYSFVYFLQNSFI